MEEFFEPVTSVLQEMLHPTIDEEEKEDRLGSAADVKGGGK